MRVLIAHSFYRVPGGEDRYVRQQVELLSADHAVELIGRANDALAPNLSTAATMAFSRAGTREIQRQIEAFAPDVVHVHNPYPSIGPAVHLAATRCGVPLVQTVHNLRFRCPNGLMFTERRVCRRCERGNYLNAVIHDCFPSGRQASAYAGALWFHRFLLRLERNVAAFVAPSVFMAEQLIGWGIARRRISTVRNFVPSVAVAPSDVGDFGVYVGRLSEEKGLRLLLEALALAGDPPFHVIGDGPIREDLISLAARLELRRTIFAGRLDPQDTKRALERCRFLVMPSLCHENAPLAALEAMAAGRPILVSTRGGLPELVGSGGGLSFDAGDASALSGCIQRLFRGRDLSQRLGDRAWRYADAELRPDRHLSTLVDVYRGALRLGSPPSTPAPRDEDGSSTGASEVDG